MYHSGAPQPRGPAAASPPTVSSSTPACTTSTSRAGCSTPRSSSAQVLSPRRSSLAAEQLQDPLILLLEMANGVLVDVEAAVNIAYGYDIRGEILGETGTVELAESGQIIVKREGRFGGRVPDRLAGAVRARLRHRVPGVDRRRRRRPLDRSELVGRLRGHRGVRRGRRGAPHRADGCRCRCASDPTSTGTATARHRHRLTGDYHGEDRARPGDVPRRPVGRRRGAQGRRAGLRYLELSPRPDFFFWHRYPKADDAAIAEVKKACKETGVHDADAGAGLQLVLPRRAGTPGPGAQLAAAAGDRRRARVPASSTPSCPATPTSRCAPSTRSTARWRSWRRTSSGTASRSTWRRTLRLRRTQRRRRADHPRPEPALGQLRVLRSARLPPLRRRRATCAG